MCIYNLGKKKKKCKKFYLIFFFILCDAVCDLKQKQQPSNKLCTKGENR